MKAKALKAGDTIGIVAPASPASSEDIQHSIRTIESMGYCIREGKSIYKKLGYLAGDDASRAADINAFFEDKQIDGIMCLRGGYGSSRILDKIDYHCIKENPKVFMGYSDITALNIAIYQKTGLITFHGPMAASNFLNPLDKLSMASMNKAIKSKTAIGIIKNPIPHSIARIHGGHTEGKLTGGNLTLISTLLGTPYEIDTKDKLLFLEDIGEEPYRIDRMLTQLKLAGKLKDAKGIILCDFNDCEAKSSQQDMRLEQVFYDVLCDYKKPVLYGYRTGHCLPIYTIPLGVKACIDGDLRQFTILESAVR